MPPNRVHDLPTPALLLEISALDHNLTTMAEALPGHATRPHVKAHKCSKLARHQYAAGHHGFTCATPREVLGLAAAGVGDDLLLANECLDPARLKPMAELDAMVTVAVDSAETVAAAAAAGIERCLIDVNVGLPRCGIAPERAGALADEARRSGLEVRGVMGYEGHLMLVPDRAERDEQVAGSMELLQRAHGDVGGDIVSAGGTGTFDLHGDTGVTEVQAGSYVLMDTAYLAQQLPFQQALFLLGTVISVSEKWAVLDVGLKAHGMDHGNPSVLGGETWFLSDEHLTYAPSQPVSPGERVRAIPAHCDPTVALHENYWIVDGDEIVDRWPIDLRGW